MKEQERVITKWEKVAIQAVEEAIADSHEKGFSTVHGDKKGVYALSPEGKKDYMKIYKDIFYAR